jgi:hypothetical protein
LTYIDIIKKGTRDRTYGMPLLALCANISWEFLFSFIKPHRPPQLIVNMIWFAFDVVILYQTLRFGPNEFKTVSPKAFYMLFMVALVTAFSVVYTTSSTFNDWNGAYSAFGQNLLMSGLFIRMLKQRKSSRGQSISIAVYKLIGTVLASLAYYLADTEKRKSVFLFGCYIATFILDAMYVSMLARNKKRNRWNL